MKSIYITISGTLKREHNTIVLRGPSLDVPRYFPIESVEDIYIMGNVNINTTLLKYLMKKGICIHMFDRYGGYLGSFLPMKPKTSANTYIKQFEHFYNYGKRVLIAKAIQIASVKSMRNFLKRHTTSDIVSEEDIETLQHYIHAMEEESSIEGLRSYEGLSRKLYFSRISTLLEEYHFSGRVNHPPGDPINAMLSYGYAVLYGKMLSLIYTTHLDPRISFVHEPTFKGYSLQLDLADLFKTAVVDSLVISLARKRQIQDTWFDRENGGTYLSSSGKKAFLYHLLKKVEQFTPDMKNTVYNLQKHITEGAQLKPFVWKG